MIVKLLICGPRASSNFNYWVVDEVTSHFESVSAGTRPLRPPLVSDIVSLLQD